MALFYSIMKPEDIFIMSKGQASPLYYAILADKGIIDEGELWKFATKEGRLGVHLDHNIPGVILTAGSLGHGLGISSGIALARKIDKKLGKVYVLLGDAECYEGSIWEAAMFAGQHKLNNLIAIVDYNRWGVIIPALNVNILGNIFFSMGWQIIDSEQEWNFPTPIGYVEPTVILVKTIKGKGISFMENKWEWHGLAPQGADAERARRELNGVV